MDKLKQVSEQPELKEEMETEVMSTNTQALTQTASRFVYNALHSGPKNQIIQFHDGIF